jgi:transposase-like protein
MNIHKNARLTPQGRFLLVERIAQNGWSVAQAAQAAGLSTRQAYCWCARYRSGGVAALADRSSAPRHCPRRTPAAQTTVIEQLRHQRLSGPAIARQLGMPASTVGKVASMSRAPTIFR